MTKNQKVNDSLIGFASWMISNLSMQHHEIPQCRRKMLSSRNVVRRKFIPAKFEWLLRLPQPAHLCALVTSLYLGFLFFPRERAPEQPSALTSLLYVACFAMHFGTQFWMTFASGLVLFFSLPRHLFGKVQQCLFPKYFLLNSLLSAATLALFVLHHPSAARGELRLQLWTLVVCFLSELSARLYIVPSLLDAMEERMALEEDAGVGMEVGCHNPGPLAYCPHYSKVNRRFRVYHGICACANVLSMVCSTLHLYFLSSKLRHALA